MSRRWLDLIEKAGDAHMGAALVRLAREAAMIHAGETARLLSETARLEARNSKFETDTKKQVGVIDGAVYMEVNR